MGASHGGLKQWLEEGWSIRDNKQMQSRQKKMVKMKAKVQLENGK